MNRSNPRVDEQRQNNLATRGAWDRFAPHRRHLTELVEQHPGRSLCVLGAGNCNDLDLPRLAQRFDALHLADLDRQAVEDGVARQAATNCQIHAPLDVSGMVGFLSGDDAWQDPDLCRQRAAAAALPPLPGPFDTVVSANLLTQLFDTAVRSRGAIDAELVPVLLALRRRHLELMLQLRGDRGRALLVTDVVSSDTCPELPQVPDEQLGAQLALWINAGNFFTGANPVAIAAELRSLGAAALQLHPPWKWNLGPRWYAVTAIGF